MKTSKRVPLNISLTAEDNVRSGVYSNFSMARSTQKESIIDFVFIDSNGDDESGKHVANGLVQSRIIMSHQSLVELRNMLDKHIEENFEKVDEDGDD